MSAQRAREEVKEGTRRMTFSVSRRDEEELDWYVSSVTGEGA